MTRKKQALRILLRGVCISFVVKFDVFYRKGRKISHTEVWLLYFGPCQACVCFSYFIAVKSGIRVRTVKMPATMKMTFVGEVTSTPSTFMTKLIFLIMVAAITGPIIMGTRL